ncbi:MAG: hypothetical protein WCP29_07315 [Acidobacteriota bacterium]
MTSPRAKGICVTKTIRSWACGLAALLACGATAMYATAPRFWLVSTHADMMKGEVDNLSIDTTGRLTLGPVFKTLYSATAPFVWTLAAGPAGVVFAGGGSGGQVWKIDASGRATEFFTAKELDVHAVLAAPDGALLVATSPNGRVYRVDSAGQSTVYFDPGDKYIWAMAFDAQGRLYVGAGDKGIIYRVSSAGKGDVFYDTHARHVTSLAFDRAGRLFASTDSPGRVLRIDQDGKAFALLDSPFRELRAVRLASDGTLYVAAIGGKSAAADDRPATAAPSIDPPRATGGGSVTTDIVTVTLVDAPTVTGQTGASPTRSPDKAGTKGAVYRIDKDGRAEIIWDSKDDSPFDLLADDDGSVTIATGGAGKLFRVAGNPVRTTLVARLGGQQITAMLASGSSRYYATSNPAKIYALSADRASDGTYVSDVKDAGATAVWGTLSWRATTPGGARVQMMTRAGNTSTPDDTWSAWSGPYALPDGEATRNPAARYFQWKATLTATPADQPGPSLSLVKIGYRQRNIRPHVISLTVLPPGMTYQRPYPVGEAEIAGLGEMPADARAPVFSLPLGNAPPPSPEAGPALGRKIYQKGLQAFSWKADDDNDDRLKYDVLVRRVESTEWTPLRRAMADQLFTWDTTSVPDGTYLVKVVASDQPGNPDADVLTDALESEAFDVDNTPPTLTVVSRVREGSQTVVVIEVADALSAIERVDYAVDAGPWRTLAPSDGIGDARRARYVLNVDPEALGRLVVRASDTVNNTATLQFTPAPARNGKLRD